MAHSSIHVITLCIFMLYTITASYAFNGYRDSFIPNNNRHQQQQNVENTQNNFIASRHCIQRDYRDFRHHPSDCNKFLMCSNSVLVTYSCPAGTVFNADDRVCVPRGSVYDNCKIDRSLIVPVVTETPERVLPGACPRGATYKKAHPNHCARYFDCGRPAMMDRWEAHEWECKYPFMFNEDTNRCEHYSMVDCGQRKIAYDQCDYKQFTCSGHSHCRPCEVSYPSCQGMKDGMNVWKGRTPSPYYVVCSKQRVVYSGTCSNGQVFDGAADTCVHDKQSIY